MGTLRTTGKMAPSSSPNHVLNQNGVDPQEVSEYNLETPA